LPTDFLLLLEKIKAVLESIKPQVETEESVSTQREPIYEEARSSVFDIDAIDTFGVESLDDKDLEPFVESSLEDEDKPLEESLLEEEEESDLELPLFDMHEDENETLDLASIQTEEDDEADGKLNTFDFDERPSSFEPLDASQEEEAPCILDKDDIDEVKQLLNESDEDVPEEDTPFNFDSPAFEEVCLEDELSLEDELEEEEPLMLEEHSLESETFRLPEEEDAEEALLLETQEELINDFEESVEVCEEEEESITPLVDISLAKPFLENTFESIDDLNENAIKKAFGEEVDEDVMEEAVAVEDSSIENKDADVIRGEIENTITRSLSTLAQSDVLREALKGMRINISITFDEKN